MLPASARARSRHRPHVGFAIKPKSTIALAFVMQGRTNCSRLLVGVALVLAQCMDFAPSRAADSALGQYLSSECVTCHRLDGAANGIPPIIGWPSDQFVAVLKSYKTKDRSNEIMQTVTARLSDEEIEALAAYYATLGTKPN